MCRVRRKNHSFAMVRRRPVRREPRCLSAGGPSIAARHRAANRHIPKLPSAQSLIFVSTARSRSTEAFCQDNMIMAPMQRHTSGADDQCARRRGGQNLCGGNIFVASWWFMWVTAHAEMYCHWLCNNECSTPKCFAQCCKAVATCSSLAPPAWSADVGSKRCIYFAIPMFANLFDTSALTNNTMCRAPLCRLCNVSGVHAKSWMSPCCNSMRAE